MNLYSNDFQFNQLEHFNPSLIDLQNEPVVFYQHKPSNCRQLQIKMTFLGQNSSYIEDDTIQQTYFIKSQQKIEQKNKDNIKIKMLEKSVDDMLSEILANELEIKYQKQQQIRDNKQQPNQENIINEEKTLWISKYSPKNYSELLSNDKLNRSILTWLKAWDPIVFNKQKKSDIQKLNMNQQINNQVSGQIINTNYFNFDLKDPFTLNLMQNNVVLLAGPPGCGKTTLARVIANHCGYQSIEVNASDERTAQKLIEKIESVTNNTNLNRLNGNEKPSLLILDEVDGTLESESQGAVDQLLKYIFVGNKKQKKLSKKKGINLNTIMDEEIIEDNEESQQQQKENQQQPNNQKDKISIKRPVIFICNDVYSKGLRELRKRSLVFNFKKDINEKLIKRLQEICQNEKLLIDNSLLQKICENNDFDIRGCLNTLEMISKGNKKGVKLTKDMLQKGQINQSLIEIVEFLSLEQSKINTSQLIYQKNKKQILQYCFKDILRNTDFNFLAEALFNNYLNLRSSERNPLEASQFMDQLCQSQTIMKKINQNQYFELTQSTMLAPYFYNIKLAGHEKLQYQFPYAAMELRKNMKSSVEMLYKFKEQMQIKNLQFNNIQKLPVEILSYIFQLFQPNIGSSIPNNQEKEDLYSAIIIMSEFNIQLLPQKQLILLNKNKKKEKQITEQFYDVEFSNNIEKFLIFNDITPYKSLNEKIKLLLLSNQEYVKQIRSQKLRNNDLNDVKELENKAIEGYKLLEQKQVKKRLQILNSGFLFKYVEGNNNAVKHDVKIDFFMNKKIY